MSTVLLTSLAMIVVLEQNQLLQKAARFVWHILHQSLDELLQFPQEGMRPTGVPGTPGRLTRTQ